MPAITLGNFGDLRTLSAWINGGRAAALVVTCVLVGARCQSNGDALAKKDPRTVDAGTDSSSAGGISGQSGTAAVGGVPSTAGSGGARATGGSGGGPVEPPGGSSVTLLNGLVDADRIALCFAPAKAGIAGVPLGTPMPAGGVDFGSRWTFTSLAGFDFGADDLVPIVIAGELGDIGGLDCADAVAKASVTPEADASADASGQAGAAGAGGVAAGGADAGSAGAGGATFSMPRLRSAPLAVIPHGTLGNDQSVLLAITGCMGAPGLVDPVDQIACGRGYSPDTPTIGLLVAAASRIVKSGSVGLQVLNASRATERFDLASTPPASSTGASVTIVRDVWYGELLPYPPLSSASRVALGIDSGYLLTLTQYSTPTLVSSWADALARGATNASDGKDYTIVLLGAVPTVGNPRWFHRPVLTVVPSDP